MKKEFTWLWTALVTPFLEWDWINNKIDYASLKNLINIQLEANVDWILLLWTTWENPTLTKKESQELVKFTIKKINKKTKIMVNIWTNSTKKSIKNLKEFEKIEWIDSYLIVNPYYNKPTQNWLFLHFTSIAKKTKKPIIIYNIKWRTAVNLETETLQKIVKSCPNVIWVKEASCDLNQMKEVIQKLWKEFTVLSWDDSLTYELIKSWWDWVISVASNAIPKQLKEMINLALIWDNKAEKLNEKYKEYFKKLFIQTNPLPIKTILSDSWIIKEEFRLPMCKMDKKEKNDLLDFIKKFD